MRFFSITAIPFAFLSAGWSAGIAFTEWSAFHEAAQPDVNIESCIAIVMFAAGSLLLILPRAA